MRERGFTKGGSSVLGTEPGTLLIRQIRKGGVNPKEKGSSARGRTRWGAGETEGEGEGEGVCREGRAPSSDGDFASHG